MSTSSPELAVSSQSRTDELQLILKRASEALLNLRAALEEGHSEETSNTAPALSPHGKPIQKPITSSATKTSAQENTVLATEGTIGFEDSSFASDPLAAVLEKFKVYCQFMVGFTIQLISEDDHRFQILIGSKASSGEILFEFGNNIPGRYEMFEAAKRAMDDPFAAIMLAQSVVSTVHQLWPTTPDGIYSVSLSERQLTVDSEGYPNAELPSQNIEGESVAVNLPLNKIWLAVPFVKALTLKDLASFLHSFATEGRSSNNSAAVEHGIRLFLSFVNPWECVLKPFGVGVIKGAEGAERKVLEMDYHLRYCEISKLSNFSPGPAWFNVSPGISIRRMKARIKGVGRVLKIYERRASAFMQLSWEEGIKTYSLHVFADKGVDDQEVMAFPEKSQWITHGMVPCGNLQGVGQFLTMIALHWERWELGWIRTLKELDLTVRVQLNDTLDEGKWNGLMTNDSYTTIYFTVLQILRIAAEWIDESIDDLKELRARWDLLYLHDAPFTKEEIRLAGTNWDNVISTAERRHKTLRDRLDRKAEEVKSLRDGLFNAISLREATRGMALNRAIYVFTVVTVIYTPIGFMATFWALPVVTSNDENRDGPPSAFIATFIIIPLLTYVISAAVAGYLTSKRIKEWILNFSSNLSAWLKKLINGLGLFRWIAALWKKFQSSEK